MSKKLLLTAAAACIATLAGAQITITSADMPVLGDTLRYSATLATTNMTLANTGANIAWDYSTLTPLAQQVDAYKSVSASGYTQSGISNSAYGYLVTDTLQFQGAPAYLTNVYTFFSNTSTRFAAVGFAAKVNGALPIAAPYSNEDEWLNFPLTYGRTDSTTFEFNASLSFLGSVKMKGYRKTTVDGWGTIVTPYLTTPTNVLRVRSEVVEMDSVTVTGTGTFGFPRHTVDYQWLAKGLRYPALLVSANVVAGQEVPTNVRYRDNYRPGLLSVGGVKQRELTQLQVYPNPAVGGSVHVTIPETWHSYETALYDAAGRMLSTTSSSNLLATETLPAGHYTIIVRSGNEYGVAQFVK